MEPLMNCFLCASSRMPAYRDALCELDAAIGDADHGVTIERGFQAFVDVFAENVVADYGTFFHMASEAMSNAMGGAIGPIYGMFFSGIAKACDGLAQIVPADLARGMEKGISKIMRIAKVESGEKTVLDAMLPAQQGLLDGAELPWAQALAQAAEAAQRGADATIPLKATKGRAKFLAERSIGHIDCGAASFALFMKELAKAAMEDMQA